MFLTLLSTSKRNGTANFHQSFRNLALIIYFPCIFFLRIWLLALAKVLYTRFRASNATRLLVFPTSALSLPHDSLLDSAHLLNVLLLCVRLPQHLCSI